MVFESGRKGLGSIAPPFPAGAEALINRGAAVGPAPVGLAEAKAE